MVVIHQAKTLAKMSGRVVQIGKHCQFCGQAEKPASEMSLDEMFSFCCEDAQRESILVHQSQNKCDLCGKYSLKSATHRECANLENIAMDCERAREETFSPA